MEVNQIIVNIGFTKAIGKNALCGNLDNVVIQIYEDRIYIEADIPESEDIFEYTATVTQRRSDYNQISLLNGMMSVYPEKRQAILKTNDGMNYHFTGMQYYVIPEICLN